ncbi:MAG: aminoglycoside 3'-phosphotransferase [Chloroflexota bacterium]|nr:aminoglycoside 3'-phosphotransferase [Chloroflexota bacterium]
MSQSRDSDRIDNMVARVLATVPHSLQPYVNECRWTRITIGKSPAATFRLDQAGHAALYLKVSPMSHRRELLRESERVTWLQGKLPVPEVIHYDADDRNEFLLLTALPGRDAASLIEDRPNETIVRLLATGLRRIHTVSIENCPFDMTLEGLIEEARFNVANNLVNEADFDEIRLGRSAAEIFEEMQSKRPADEDLVFTHGDYCLPNVIIDGENVAGFVDWGSAGVADRYRDIALVVRSLARNTGEDLARSFYTAYGLSRPDTEKVTYYQLLDEFW